MSGKVMKGTAVQPQIDWIRERYGEETLAAVLGRLSASDRAELEHVFPTSTYPLSLVNGLCTGLADARFVGNRRAADEAFRDMGRYVAETSLSGVYDTFLRTATPAKMLERIPRMLGAMVDGTSADCEPGADGRSAVVHVHGLEELAYSGPRFCGWSEGAMNKAGASRVVASERTWDAGMDSSNDLVIDIRWSV